MPTNTDPKARVTQLPATKINKAPAAPTPTIIAPVAFFSPVLSATHPIRGEAIIPVPLTRPTAHAAAFTDKPMSVA